MAYHIARGLFKIHSKLSFYLNGIFFLMCSFHIDIVGVHPGFYFLLEVSKIAGCIGSGCGPRLGFSNDSSNAYHRLRGVYCC